MIIMKCDRCGGDMDPNGIVGYISWCFKQGVEGDLGANDLERNHFCERCMDEIRAFINFPVKWEPSVNERKSEVHNKTDILQKQDKKCQKKPGDSSEKRSVRRIKPSEAEAILELKERGFKIREIAEELEMEPKKVQNWLYNHKKAVE